MASARRHMLGTNCPLHRLTFGGAKEQASGPYQAGSYLWHWGHLWWTPGPCGGVGFKRDDIRTNWKRQSNNKRTARKTTNQISTPG
jgi:hypothetical protein